MSSLERFLWSSAYFAAGASLLALMTMLARVFPSPTLWTVLFFAIVAVWWPVWSRYGSRIVRGLGWGTRVIAFAAGRSLNPLLWRLVHRGAHEALVDGIIVYPFLDDLERRAVREQRMGAAFARLREISPSRYRRLQRLRPAIAVFSFRGAGGYMNGANAIILDEVHVDQAPLDVVVALVLHELSHAHVDSLGIRVTPWNDNRIEMLAHAEMAHWARRLRQAGRIAEADAVIHSVRRAMQRPWRGEDGSWVVVPAELRSL